MNKTDLRLQYVNRTWGFSLPESIEQTLEDDYVINSRIYTDEMFNYIRTQCLIEPNIEPAQLLCRIHEYSSDSDSPKDRSGPIGAAGPEITCRWTE